MSAFTDTSRLSLNQYTTHEWSLPEAVQGCVDAGLGYIGLWRDKIAATSLEESARICRDAGVQVSSICRGGMFPAETESERLVKIDDNRRAIDECATIGTDTLVLVCGGLATKDIQTARNQVQDGIASVVDYAIERGVKLGIEPLHPMFAADRSVINTLGQSLDICEAIGSPQVGVIIDVFHVWWDPYVYEQIKRAKGRIFGFHVNDWFPTPPEVLLSRAMMGDGVIELRRLREAVEAEGYDGPIECEIFNRQIWDSPGDQVVKRMKETYLEFC